MNKARPHTIFCDTRPRSNAERLMLWRRRRDSQPVDRFPWRLVLTEAARLVLLIAGWLGVLVGMVYAFDLLIGTVYH